MGCNNRINPSLLIYKNGVLIYKIFTIFKNSFTDSLNHSITIIALQYFVHIWICHETPTDWRVLEQRKQSICHRSASAVLQGLLCGILYHHVINSFHGHH